MSRPQLHIAQGKEKALQRRHPWVFSGAVKRIDGEPQEGDVVDIVDSHGEWMATGLYQNDSIICKVLSFESAEVDPDFIRQRLHSAIGYRQRMGLFSNEDTNVFRLVHAEGDYLPSLVADWYGGLLVIQAHSIGMHRWLPQLVECFVQELGPLGLKSIYDKSSATLPIASTDGYIWGEERAEWEVRENGIRLIINPAEGQKTGFFVDQRENRRMVGQLAAGHRVLNCFGYTGGFSLAALAGGASFVETVDISRRAIELCQRNVELNFGHDERHRGTVADVLQYLCGPQTASFDFIILDPPAFAKSHRHLQQGLKGYRAINRRAMEALPEGGLLMTFSCSQAVSRDDFQTMVFTSAMEARRKVRIVRQLPHAVDHPVSIHHPEGEYLKGLLLEVE